MSSKSKIALVIIILFMCAASFTLGSIVGHSRGLTAGENIIKAEAVKRNVAEYDRKTGIWKWR